MTPILVKKNAYCDATMAASTASHHELDYAYPGLQKAATTPAGCARLCKLRSACKFFRNKKNVNSWASGDKTCIHEVDITDGTTCSTGWVTDTDWDVYAVEATDLPAPTLLAANKVC